MKTYATCIFSLLVFAFFAFVHPELLSYHEQYQLFLFSADYLLSRLCVAGGLASYMTEFVVQFFYIAPLGALCVALLMAAVQQLCWQCCRRCGATEGGYWASFVPPALMVAYMSDENALLSFAVAVAFTMLTAVALLGIERWRMLACAAAMPVLYWAAGPVSVVALALMTCAEAYNGRATARRMYIYVLLAAWWALCVYLMAEAFMQQYPWTDVWLSIDYHRDRLTYPAMQHAVALSVVCAPLLARALAVRRWQILATLLVAAWGGIYAMYAVQSDKFLCLRYDYYVRNERWNDIISDAERNKPTEALALNSVNLALGITGQLTDRMFEFNQCGSEGLFSIFRRDMVSCVPTAEAYFRLGMTNEALRCYFDSQEAILNGNKSGRMTKRIAEANLINGRYGVARKYISALKRTLFYRPWALEAEQLLGNENAINAHPLYGPMRRKHFTKQFIFSTETSKMLAQLWIDCKSNRLALDYMVANMLLDCDMPMFYNVLASVSEGYGGRLPRHCREAVAMFWLQGMPISGVRIDDAILREVKSFDTSYLLAANRNAMLRSRWKDTFWTYCLVKYPSIAGAPVGAPVKH